jgi:hypothetical protein
LFYDQRQDESQAADLCGSGEFKRKPKSARRILCALGRI